MKIISLLARYSTSTLFALLIVFFAAKVAEDVAVVGFWTGAAILTLVAGFILLIVWQLKRLSAFAKYFRLQRRTA